MDVVAVPADTQPEREEEKQEADSAGVTALRNMGFDITADVRAVLESAATETLQLFWRR